MYDSLFDSSVIINKYQGNATYILGREFQKMDKTNTTLLKSKNVICELCILTPRVTETGKQHYVFSK